VPEWPHDKLPQTILGVPWVRYLGLVSSLMSPLRGLGSSFREGGSLCLPLGVQGLVECVGVSDCGPKQLMRIYSYLEARGVPLASAQVRFLLLVPPP